MVATIDASLVSANMTSITDPVDVPVRIAETIAISPIKIAVPPTVLIPT